MPDPAPAPEISTDRARIDRSLVHAFLSRESYWAVGVSRETVDRSIDGSIPFGLYEDGRQVGFARAVTDGATFAWIADVFVVASHRRRGLGRRLVEAVLAHPEVAAARHVLLATADAHGLYTGYGFTPLAEPHRWLSRRRSDREPFAPAAGEESSDTASPPDWRAPQ